MSFICKQGSVSVCVLGYYNEKYSVQYIRNIFLKKNSIIIYSLHDIYTIFFITAFLRAYAFF